MTLPPYLRDPRTIVGLVIVLAVFLTAVFAPLLAPHDPDTQDLLWVLLPPSWQPGGDPNFPLGTDSLGRDVLSRLIYSARVAMTVAIVSAVGAMILGTIAALLAGYFGGWVDTLISRTVDVWISFPPVVLSLILIVGLGVGLDKVILAIILVDWTRFCRVLRAEVILVRQQAYVSAARMLGQSHFITLSREVLPAVVPLIITLFSLEMGIAVTVEAILSFVGMGVSANIPAWGQMIADARMNIYDSPWGLFLPIAAVFVTVAGFNLLGEGLRKGLDARQNTSRGV
ncbi:ABC transporter permease [Marinibacterium sp. SX1]|uniref:ABC transporter permease n=1 Tax=Marinibacterium sp. SX1 TaxID=3388424 RepID=UPI003D1696D4